MEADAESCLIAAGCADACFNARAGGRERAGSEKGQAEDKRQ